MLWSIGGASADWTGETRYLTVGGTLGGILFLPPLLMILFRRKYPRWWFDFNLELQRFTNRVGAYLALMHDRYPSTDEKQYVTLEIPYPDAARELNRWLPLVKWLLAIPHYVVLLFLWLAALLFAIAAWFAILFTGRFPRGMFDFIESVLRWTPTRQPSRQCAHTNATTAYRREVRAEIARILPTSQTSAEQDRARAEKAALVRAGIRGRSARDTSDVDGPPAMQT